MNRIKSYQTLMIILLLMIYIFGVSATPCAAVNNTSTSNDNNTFLAQQSDEAYANPTAEEILSDLTEVTPNRQHPRLMVTPDTLPVLKDKIKNDSTVKKWMETIRKNADSYLSAAALKYELTDSAGRSMLNTARTAKKQITTLSFMYLVTQEQNYAAKATEIMLNVCSFPDWNPYHFLDTAELSAGVAIGYDWLYSYLSSEDKSIIRTALLNKAVLTALGDFKGEPDGERTWAWYSDKSSAYPNNWISVCYGGAVLASLAIADECGDDAIKAAEVISVGMKQEKDFLATFAPDGACLEGPTYWKYSYEFFAFCFESMKTALGTDYGLGTAQGLHNGGYYMIGNMGPAGSFNLSDADRAFLNCFEIFWISKYYSDPALTKYRVQYMNENNLLPEWRDIMFYQPEYALSDAIIPTDGLYRTLEVSASRVSFDKNDLYVGFHGGDAGTSHSHLDYGNYIIDMFGKRWATELGKDDATYVNTGRYNYYRDRAEGHNTIIFNPDSGEDHNKDAITPITRFETNIAGSISTVDLTEVHRYRGAESVIRGVKVDKINRSVLIQDEIKMSSPAEMYWFMHSLGKIQISSDGRSATITDGTNKMQAQLIGGDGLVFTVMQQEPLPTSPKGTDMADDSYKQKLVIHGVNITNIDFAVRISPLCGAETATSSNESLTAISDWRLTEADELPLLTNIYIDGKAIDGFSSDNTMYTAEYEPYTDVKITAEGNGTITVTPPEAENSAARITITKDGKSRVYLIQFTRSNNVTFDFESMKSKYTTAPHILREVGSAAVTSSSTPQSEHPVSAVNDGNKSSYWTTDTKGTELTFDLGKLSRVNLIGTAFYMGNERQAMFRLAVSADGLHWDAIRNIKTSGGTDDMEFYDIGEQRTRYIRIISYGTTTGNYFSPSEIHFYAQDGLIIPYRRIS